jgi:hypothetical protein
VLVIWLYSTFAKDFDLNHPSSNRRNWTPGTLFISKGWGFLIN